MARRESFELFSRQVKIILDIEKEKIEGNQTKYLEGSPVSLVCLNISTYRGVTEAWKKADGSNHRDTQSYYDGKL